MRLLLLLRELLLLLLLRHGVRMLLMLMLTRVGMLMLVMRVRQSFVVHASGLEGELMVPGLGLRVLERRVGMIGMVICGRVEVGSGEVEQAVLLGEVEVLHCAWCSGFDGQYTRESR